MIGERQRLALHVVPVERLDELHRADLMVDQDEGGGLRPERSGHGVSPEQTTASCSREPVASCAAQASVSRALRNPIVITVSQLAVICRQRLPNEHALTAMLAFDRTADYARPAQGLGVMAGFDPIGVAESWGFAPQPGAWSLAEGAAEMTDGASISTELMAQWWGQAPEERAREGSMIDASIWSGEAREITSGVDPATHIVSMALVAYDCIAFVDGRAIERPRWRRGDVQIMTAGVAPRAVIGSRFRMLHVYMPQARLEAAAEDLGCAGGVELIDPRGTADPTVVATMFAVEGELGRGAQGSRLLLDSYGVELGVQLLRSSSNRSGELTAPGAAKGGLAPWQLKRAQDAMQAQLDGSIALGELAAVVGLSETHFSRAFKRSTGLAPFHWLAAQRICRAQALLADGRRSLAEVALEVGFAGQPAFTTAFRRATGTTPGRWQRDRRA